MIDPAVMLAWLRVFVCCWTGPGGDGHFEIDGPFLCIVLDAQQADLNGDNVTDLRDFAIWTNAISELMTP